MRPLAPEVKIRDDGAEEDEVDKSIAISAGGPRLLLLPVGSSSNAGDDDDLNSNSAPINTTGTGFVWFLLILT